MASDAERLDLHINAQMKELLLIAAAVAGESMADFVLKASIERAEQILDEHSSIRLPNRAFDEFMAACEHAPEPSQHLKNTLALADKGGIR